METMNTEILRQIKWLSMSTGRQIAFTIQERPIGMHDLLNTKLHNDSLKMCYQAWEGTFTAMEEEPVGTVNSHEECFGTVPFKSGSPMCAKELHKVGSTGPETFWKISNKEVS